MSDYRSLVSSKLSVRESLSGVGESHWGFLVPCDGGTPIALRRSKFRVGRSPECEIVLNEKTVSSTHCAFELVNGFWQVRDLDSRNGTTVNGAPCRSMQLDPGSILGFAGKQFRLEYRPESNSAALNLEHTVLAPKIPLSARFTLFAVRFRRWGQMAQTVLSVLVVLALVALTGVFAPDVVAVGLALLAVWLLFTVGDRLGLTLRGLDTEAAS